MSDEANVSVDNIEFDEDLGILHCKNCECWLNTCMHTHKYIKRLKRLDENVKKRIAHHRAIYDALLIHEPNRFDNMRQELKEIELLESLYK